MSSQLLTKKILLSLILYLGLALILTSLTVELFFPHTSPNQFAVLNIIIIALSLVGQVSLLIYVWQTIVLQKQFLRQMDNSTFLAAKYRLRFYQHLIVGTIFLFSLQNIMCYLLFYFPMHNNWIHFGLGFILITIAVVWIILIIVYDVLLRLRMQAVFVLIQRQTSQNLPETFSLTKEKPATSEVLKF